MSSAAVFGSTGAVGKHILSTLLSTPEFTKVGEFGRRVTSLDSLQGDKSKLVQKTVDFEKISEEPALKEHWDVVYISLGTTRALAGSAEAFEKIDREYVIAAAKAAKSTGSQRLVYVSSGGANKNSPFLYMKSKGLTEEGLASLGYSETIIMRPGFLANAERQRGGMAENVLNSLARVLRPVSSGYQIDVSVLGRAVVNAGWFGSAKLPKDADASMVESDGVKFTLIGNVGAIKLANHNLS